MTDPQTSKEGRKSTPDTRTDARHKTAESDRGAANAIPSYAQTNTEAPVIPKLVQTNAMSKSAQAKYDLAIASAEENYKLATQKCNALGGVD